MAPIDAYVALGSNLGDRRTFLRRALDALQDVEGIELTSVSSVYETEPVGGPVGQPQFLNLAAGIRTTLTPSELLAAVQGIERDLGRLRDVPQGPRTIDIDILLYDDLVRPEPDPVIPHLRMHHRAFVLRPMAEIAPDVMHPVLGVSMGQLSTRLPDQRPMRRFPLHTGAGVP